MATRSDLDVETVPAWMTECLNCRHALQGPFCARCGQRAMPPHPTVAELMTDAYQELVGWDGKVLDTLRTLIARPGEATRRLLDGQRARYISPVRLYIACSVLYFLVAAAVPDPDLSDAPFEVGIGVGTGSSQPTEGDAALAKAVRERLSSLSPTERAAAEAALAEQPRLLQPLVRALAEDSAGIRERVSTTMPRALFALIPALAAILSLFHRGHRFLDHVYLAIHLQTVVFIGLALAASLELFSWWAGTFAQLGAAGWILAYSVIAQRRVYGGTRLANVLKAVGVGAIYFVLWSAVSVAVTVWVTL